MLRKISLFTACVFTALTLAAQTEPVDTVPSTDLAEIVIEAPKVIRKTDRDVFYPSQSAVDASKNGLQLTRNLMIPTLSVNDINGSITSAGKRWKCALTAARPLSSKCRSFCRKPSRKWSG